MSMNDDFTLKINLKQTFLHPTILNCLNLEVPFTHQGQHSLIDVFLVNL